jgi:hypothetical protein
MKQMKLIDKVDAKPTEEYSTAQEEAEMRYDEGERIYSNVKLNILNLLTKCKNDIIGNEEGMDF